MKANQICIVRNYFVRLWEFLKPGMCWVKVSMPCFVGIIFVCGVCACPCVYSQGIYMKVAFTDDKDAVHMNS